MKSDFKCFIGLHHYEIIKEDTLVDSRDNVVGKVLISRCTNCGKIKSTRIYTDISYGKEIV